MKNQSQKSRRLSPQQEGQAFCMDDPENSLAPCLGLTGNLLSLGNVGSIWAAGGAPTRCRDQRDPWTSHSLCLEICPQAGSRGHLETYSMNTRQARGPTRPGEVPPRSRDLQREFRGGVDLDHNNKDPFISPSL